MFTKLVITATTRELMSVILKLVKSSFRNHIVQIGTCGGGLNSQSRTNTIKCTLFMFS